MNTFIFSRFARTDARSGIWNRDESPLSPVVGIDVGGRVVTFGAYGNQNGLFHARKQGKSVFCLLSEALLIMTTNLCTEGLDNTCSYPPKRVDVVTLITTLSSLKNIASVALPFNSMLDRIKQKNIFEVAPRVPFATFTATSKPSAAILQTGSKPIAAKYCNKQDHQQK